MVKYFCDICGREIKNDLEIEEIIFINHTCGYNSIFGDGANLNLDICQHCFGKMLLSVNFDIKKEHE